jgi:putative membrane fusion protein
MPRGLWVAAVVGGLIGALVLGVGIARYVVTSRLPETVTLTRGTVELALPLDTLVVRKEQVYTAPAAGRVRPLVEEGQRVRVGAPVVRILPESAPATGSPATGSQTPATGSSVPAIGTHTPATGIQTDAGIRAQIDALSEQIYQTALAANQARDKGDEQERERLMGLMDQMSARQADLAAQLGRTAAVVLPEPVQQPQPQTPAATAQEPKALAEVSTEVAGVLTYQTDGMEGVLIPGGSKTWTPSLIRSLAPEPRKTGETVAKGAPLFKVVDNLSLSLLAVVPAGSLDGVPADARLFLRFPGHEEQPVATRVTRWDPVGGEQILLMTAPVFPEEFTQVRRVRATLVIGSFSGAIVPRSAIDVRDGKQGIWVIKGRTPVFYPARVVGGNEQDVALETDLQPGISVVKAAPTWMH